MSSRVLKVCRLQTSFLPDRYPSIVDQEPRSCGVLCFMRDYCCPNKGYVRRIASAMIFQCAITIKKGSTGQAVLPRSIVSGVSLP